MELQANIIVSDIGDCVVLVLHDKERRAVAIGVYSVVERYRVIVLFSFDLLEILVMGKIKFVDIVTHFHFQAIGDV
ncbi:MAG: hypothetical protein IKJ18_08630 [Bacteroidaceae bacterium]|nr:hypothetical protein [Bacteroidaceae bacterium]